MRYRRLGDWGVQVSAVCLGTWLTHGRQPGDEDDAVERTRRAYDLGVNLFDTANEYQGGRAEELLGKALAGLRRETYLVATKVYQPMGDSPLERGLSRKHVMAQADASLRRLGLDHIDLYQCHRFDVAVPVEETARTMDDLVRQGKVLYWGVSEWSADQLSHVVGLCRANGWAVPVSDQAQYSAVWRGIEDRVLPTCRSLGMGVLAWSPLAMGVLTGKYRPGTAPPAGSRRDGPDGWFLDRYWKSGVLEAVRELPALAVEQGCTVAQLALGWCLRRPEVSGVIVGANRAAQVEENVAAADLDLDPEVVARLDALLGPVSVT
jgi:aryl-alcohol dehydrogenase-like predicted oxidoreductase